MDLTRDKKRRTILEFFGINNLNEIDTISAKLKGGFDVDTKDSGGRTLLMQAVIEKNYDLMTFLVENGADVNSQDARSWTALHFGAQNSDHDAVKILLENKADVTRVDDYGNSVLSTAVFNSRGECSVIKLLLSFGADASVKNKSGVSAMSLAHTISNYDVMHCFEGRKPKVE